jgi:hypothetical protein
MQEQKEQPPNPQGGNWDQITGLYFNIYRLSPTVKKSDFNKITA